MTNSELHEQAELLDVLNAKAQALLVSLAAINSAFGELPTLDELQEIASMVGEIESGLENARKTYNSDDFPSEANGLDEIAKEAQALAGSLTEAVEAYTGDDFPSVNDLQSLSREAAELASSLAESNGE